MLVSFKICLGRVLTMKAEDKKYHYSILFIEDDTALRVNYVNYLKHYFEEVYEARDIEQAQRIYRTKRPSILIVDNHLPGESGINFIKRIRMNDQVTRIIMLTANSDTQLLLQAAELKLTKYLLKPVDRTSLKEALVSAVDELIRYSIFNNKVIVLKNDFVWDNEKKSLFKSGEEIFLTKKEMELLSVLFRDINRVHKTKDIIYELWDYDAPKEAALKTLIKGLRKKLPENFIKNIFGVGYKIEVQ